MVFFTNIVMAWGPFSLSKEILMDLPPPGEQIMQLTVASPTKLNI